MGSFLSCVASSFLLRRRDSNTNDDTALGKKVKSSFDVGHALEYLRPDVSLGRHVAIKPNILLSGDQFLRLQPYLPTRFQYQRWRLIYGTEYHGFSRAAMQHECALSMREDRGLERPSILIIAAGDTGDILLGAYLSTIPQSTHRRYIGNEESFVFCTTQSSLEERIATAKATALEPSTKSSTSTAPASAAASPYLTSLDDTIHVFGVPDNASNRYIMRCEDGAIAVGGGGKGPALMLTTDFGTVSSSTYCPTFGLTSSLLFVATGKKNKNNDIGNGDISEEWDLPAGMRVDAGEPSASVRAIEIWTVGDEYFATL